MTSGSKKKKKNHNIEIFTPENIFTYRISKKKKKKKKSGVSISQSPLALLKISLTGFQNQIFWGFVFQL